MLEMIVVVWFVVGSIAAIIISMQIGGHPILSVIFGMIAGPAIAVAWIALLIERMIQKKGP